MLWNAFHSNYRPFLPDTNTFPNSVPPLPDSQQITLYHFVDESCACTRFSIPHIEEVEARYAHVRHVQVKAGETVASALRDRFNWVVASPALAIVSAQGNVLYYGPYTDGALCGEGQSLVDLVMDRPTDASNSQWLNVLAYGCFCHWPEPIQSLEKHNNNSLEHDQKQFSI